MNAIIWKGVLSTTIKGLIISELPPITKPEMRITETLIDGVDGSVIEDLGYAPYDKPLTIGLHGDYDIDEVMKYFTGEGEVVFSNEPDKVYNAKILSQIDYNRLLRFKQATILFRTQPFKYAYNEEKRHTETGTASGTNIVVNDSEDANLKSLKIFGKTTQNGTPTPDAPVELVSVGDDGNITLNISGGDVQRQITFTAHLRAIPVTDESLATYTDAEGKMWYADEIDLKRGVYIQRVGGRVLDGSSKEKWSNNATNTNKHRVCTTALSGIMIGVPNTSIAVLMSECYVTQTANSTYLNTEGISANPDGTIYIFDSRYNTTDISSWTSYLNSNPLKIFYGLKKPNEIPLTEEQIASCENLKTNNPTTTILNNENAYMSVEYFKPFEVENKGLETSKPIMTITGEGTVEVSVNDANVFTYTFPEGDNEVTIDSEKQEAHFINILKNRNMNGVFPTLQSGTNTIKWSGNVESIHIEQKSRWL